MTVIHEIQFPNEIASFSVCSFCIVVDGALFDVH